MRQSIQGALKRRGEESAVKGASEMRGVLNLAIVYEAQPESLS
ncbi:hypothetical protein ACTUM0_07415 [Schaalia turicensis]